MKRKYIPAWLLALTLKAKANIGFILFIGGGLIIIGWLGAKAISKLMDLQEQERQRQDAQDQAATPITGPTLSQVMAMTNENPVFALAAEPVKAPTYPNWPLGPEREHNQDHRLKVDFWGSQSTMAVLVPTYTAIDISFDGYNWLPWKTNLGPDFVELFPTDMDTMFFVKSRGVNKPIIK